MESPQLENGYLKIANEIFDAFCRTRISGVERQILDCILRKTYGWGKCEDAISLSQFAVMTGVKKPNIERAINGLLSKKIITIIKNDNDGINVYRFVKDFSKWAPLPKKITLSKMIKNVIKNDNLPLSKMIPTKDTNTKEKKKGSSTQILSSIEEEFNKFWNAYPNKKEKKYALGCWKKLNGSKPSIEVILKAIDDQKKWRDTANGDFRPPWKNASTWLNKGCWEDEGVILEDKSSW